MSKHLLLGKTIRHNSGSSKLINILNRFGLSASHSKQLELETAVSDSVTECNLNLPPTATKQEKFPHFYWDNFIC